jgi:tRNA-2-methylthio-N6-dimethylallyladenosine synthase
MGRQYTTEHYLERLARIRAAVPDMTVSTDVIVGFCGETEAQFERTLRFLEAVRYDQVFSAAYSERPGTPATRLADDVPAAVKRRRLHDLLALQEPIGQARNREWLGRDVEVLVDAVARERAHDHDRPDPAGEGGEPWGVRPGPGEVALSGRTRGNKLVHLAGGPDWIGQLVTVRVEHAGPYALRGTAVA